MATSPYDYLNPKYYWKNHGPREWTTVWMDNDAYARLKDDLAYYRRNPGKADPSKLLELLGQIINAWDGERSSFSQTQQELARQYNNLVDAVNSKTDEIRRLNDKILSLDSQLHEQERQQRKLQDQINELITERNRNTQLATKYLNEAVEAFNRVANEPSYLKFVPDRMEALRFLFQRVNDLDLDPAAVQGIAVDALGKLFAMNKEVMRKRIEFDLMYEVVNSDAVDLQAQYRDWQNNVYFDAPDNTKKADMAFWSYNLFPELQESVESVCLYLDNAPCDPSVQVKELREVQKQLTELREYGVQAVNDVLMRSLQSEKAEALGNIASLILVEDFLFKVIYLGFNNNDERSSYVTQLTNRASGISIQFVFTPLGPTQIGCNYEVSFDGYQDEERVKAILDYIWREMRPNKINPSERPDGEDKHIVDHIDFVKPGQSARLQEPTPTTKL